MGYTALLFCPDDKTARTVTQVLSELEFAVEACIEPFAAVKKLMGTHFDAVVVDCDNEQNATLLFKSARNSTSNQTSLAVAVVEGQAGVAKAFRIGANLVLTKPINIEQAKGTLRVARGLLRKSEPGKPGASSTTTQAIPVPAPPAPAAPVAAKPAAPKPVPAAKPAAPKPAAAPPANSPLPPRPVTTTAKPATTQAWPAAAAASIKPAAQSDNAPGFDAQESRPAPTASASIASVKPAATPVSARTSEVKTSFASPSFGSGAASAPAPALEPQEPKITERPAGHSTNVAERPAESTSAPSAYVGAAPTFSFGGANAQPESSGGNKKVLIGIAAIVVLGAVGVFAWTQMKGHSAATPTPTAPVAATTPQPQPKPSVEPAPAPTATTPASTEPATEVAAATPAGKEPESESVESAKSASSRASKPAKTESVAASKPAAPEPEPEPMVVKGGKVPAKTDSGAAEATAAPSMAGMAMPGAAPPPDLGATSTASARPMLQSLSISQGVSQGLLYKKVAPTYPPNAIRMRIEGEVQLQATISKSGSITLVKVLSGDPQLAQSAMDAVKQWKYKPYLLNGEPVEIQTQVTINFKLPR